MARGRRAAGRAAPAASSSARRRSSAAPAAAQDRPRDTQAVPFPACPGIALVHAAREGRAPLRPGGAQGEPAPDRPAVPPLQAEALVVCALIVFAVGARRRSRRSCCATSLDDGDPPGHVTFDLRLLSVLVAGMIAISLVTGAFGVVQSLPLDAGRPERDARPAHLGLPAPAAALARVLHEDAHRRGAEPDRERHRRRRQRPHLDRDLGHVDGHDGDRDRDRDVPARAGSSRSSRSR